MPRLPFRSQQETNRGRSASRPAPRTSDPQPDGPRSEKPEHSPAQKASRSTLGILRDTQTDEVPGSILLLSGSSRRNAPLGSTPRRQSASSLPSESSRIRSSSQQSGQQHKPQKKRTTDGKIILDPQPEDSHNDPLNWTAIRRDAALVSLGLYCMLGGGMTTILAAGFTNVAETYNVSIPQIALTTGIYMLGLGVGGVIMSPTAIIYGKRPVYLVTSILFVLSSVWCALSPNYASLVIARIVQGITVSPVEVLPSATIAEIFFLHERAYRLGIYTLLLLGGKNLVPLVSAAIVQSLGWRWVFWMVAIIAGFMGMLLFFFVPETFWDRTPSPTATDIHHLPRPNLSSLRKWSTAQSPRIARTRSNLETLEGAAPDEQCTPCRGSPVNPSTVEKVTTQLKTRPSRRAHFDLGDDDNDGTSERSKTGVTTSPESNESVEHGVMEVESKRPTDTESGGQRASVEKPAYTTKHRHGPTKTYFDTLKPYNGRLSNDAWWRIALRPFMLATYPAILWSAAVYALSVGWLIVISESASTIYRSSAYQFSALQTGLVYISPFIGGILGTAVAGKVSDYIVRYMSRQNGGVYEPEFRLVMAIPVALSTTIGLMGYGWSAQVEDAWIVPTVFFGIVSFGCTLGSTTAITFAVDSYRQYAGEALVTLNFCKNVLHGFVFSLFFNDWLDNDGSRTVFLALGGIQLGILLFSIPMYIYGKRARMWTVRRNFMEKF